jgi:hypothetical protein
VTLSCPGCGATPDAGCVINVAAAMEGASLSEQYICTGHERPHWLKEGGADHRLRNSEINGDDAVQEGKAW